MVCSVIGGGSFGTALAKILAENGHLVHLWSHSQDTLAALKKGENSIYLPGIRLPDGILPTDDRKSAVAAAELIVMAVPTQVTREVLLQFIDFIPDKAIIIGASKGIEENSLLLVSQIFEEICLRKFGKKFLTNLCFLSGPSFAVELAQKVPTAITIAGHDTETIKIAQQTFSNEYFRIYGTRDVLGVEIGGALKNVMAIATGISDGLNMGNNTRAALITRGLAEMARLGKKMGADPLTFMGLAGMGDLVLTCTGALSRNRNVGMKLGQGKKLAEIVAETRMVAEGVATTRSASQLCEKLQVDMPITSAVYDILYKEKNPQDVLGELMSRRLKFENL